MSEDKNFLSENKIRSVTFM